jgi:putative transposase
LKKANELLKKGLGVHLLLLSRQEKTRLVDALKHTYALSDLLVELDLARSSYFYHFARLKSLDKYADARVAITDVFSEQFPVATVTGGCVQHLAGARCSFPRRSSNA